MLTPEIAAKFNLTHHETLELLLESEELREGGRREGYITLNEPEASAKGLIAVRVNP